MQPIQNLSELGFTLEERLGRGEIAEVWRTSQQEALKIVFCLSQYDAWVTFTDPGETTLQKMFETQEDAQKAGYSHARLVRSIHTLPGRRLLCSPAHEVLVHGHLGGKGRWNDYGVMPFLGAYTWKEDEEDWIATRMPLAEGTLESLLWKKRGGRINRTTFHPLLEGSAEGISKRKNGRWVIRASQMAVFCFQILVALHRLQQDFQFVHLDLHAGNVFVFQPSLLPPHVPETEFHLSGQHYVLPPCPLRALIGDLNLSSMTLEGIRYESLDLQNYNQAPHNQLIYSGHLTGEFRPGYDAQTLFGSKAWNSGSGYAGYKPLEIFWKRLRAVSLGKNGTNHPEEDRPQKVSTQTPLQVLTEVFGKDPLPWYDFRRAQPPVASSSSPSPVSSSCPL